MENLVQSMDPPMTLQEGCTIVSSRMHENMGATNICDKDWNCFLLSEAIIAICSEGGRNLAFRYYSK